MLLPRRERQHITALADGIDGLTANPPRHLAYQLLPRGEQTDIGAAKIQAVADRLPLGCDDIGAHLAWWLEPGERHDLRRHHHQQRTGGVAGIGQGCQIGDMAEHIRVLYYHRADSAV